MGSELDTLRSILDDWSHRHGCAGAICQIPSTEEAFSLSGLSDRERDLLAAHRHPRRRLDWLGGRYAAKAAAKRWATSRHQAPSEAEILKETSGKPILANRDDLHLTIAHSGDYAVAVVGNRPLGIDLERLEERPDSLERAFFSAEEQEWVGQDPSMRSRRRDQVWTRKEAVSKLLGKGGQLLFSGLAVLDEESPWHLETAATEGYTISLALEKGM
jgi:phosphopantetheinyl transferase